MRSGGRVAVELQTVVRSGPVISLAGMHPSIPVTKLRDTVATSWCADNSCLFGIK